MTYLFLNVRSTMADVDTDWRRAGDAARARRDALGLNQEDLQGLSVATTRKIERGIYVSPKKRRAYEHAVGWPAETLDHIAAGGDPPDHVEETPTQLVRGIADRLAALETRLAALETRLDEQGP